MIDAARPCHREALGAEGVDPDPDVAGLRRDGTEWRRHADQASDTPPLDPILASGRDRGIGAELRLHSRGPRSVGSCRRRA